MLRNILMRACKSSCCLLIDLIRPSLTALSPQRRKPHSGEPSTCRSCDLASVCAKPTRFLPRSFLQFYVRVAFAFYSFIKAYLRSSTHIVLVFVYIIARTRTQCTPSTSVAREPCFMFHLFFFLFYEDCSGAADADIEFKIIQGRHNIRQYRGRQRGH